MIVVALSSPAAPPAAAGKAERLDADFLDYLAACEGKDDNWTVIAGEKQRRKETEKDSPRTKPPAGKAAAKPEDKP